MNLPAALRIATIVIVALVLTACSATASRPGVTGPAVIAPQDQTGSSDDPILVDPIPGGNGELTVPRPGQLEVHPVRADTLEAVVDGRAVTLRIGWTSGVEPCSVLDTIVVNRSGQALSITLNEGHGPGDNVCIEIAKFKFALVDLGELEPGTYTISDATGGATPIEVVVG